MKNYLFFTLLMASIGISIQCMQTDTIQVEFTVDNVNYKATESGGSVKVEPSISELSPLDRSYIMNQARSAISQKKEEVAKAKQRATVEQYGDRLQSLYNYFSSLLLPSTGKTFGEVKEKKEPIIEAQQAYAYQASAETTSPAQETSGATFDFDNVKYSAEKTASGSLKIVRYQDNTIPDKNLMTTLMPLAISAIDEHEQNLKEGRRLAREQEEYERTSYLQRIGLYLKKKTQDAYNYYWQKK